jgi:ectoine hydroxylase-related dioxygenase (phytanoyl-CoA dioxygenase family)
MLTKAQYLHFMKQGYLVLHDVIPADLRQYACEKIWSWMPDHFEKRKSSTWTGPVSDCRTDLEICHRRGHVKMQKGGKAGQIGDDLRFQSLVGKNPAVVEAVSDLLGTELGQPRLRGFYSVWPMPKFLSVDQLTGGKIRNPVIKTIAHSVKLPLLFTFPPEPHIEAHGMDIVAVGYLSDARRVGGGLAVWPGSHRDIYPEFQSTTEFLPRPSYVKVAKRLQLKRPTIISAPAGSVILFHHRLMHAASINRRSDPRHAVFVDFSRANADEYAALSPTRELWAHWPGLGEHRQRKCWRGTAVAEMPASRSRLFWRKHSGLRRSIESIVQPASSLREGMRYVPARGRALGEHWLLVSESPVGFDTAASEMFSKLEFGKDVFLTLDDQKIGDDGASNAPIRLVTAAGRLRIRTTAERSLYVRLIKTTLPVHKSPVVLRRKLVGDGTIDLTTELAA